MNITIPIVSKDEFRKLLLEHLIHDKMNYSKEEVIELVMDTGFPKLDFERLDTCLKEMFVYLPNVAVETGDSEFIWVVAGSDAILVKKQKQ